MSEDRKKERGVWVTQAQVRLTGSPDVARFLAQCVFWSENDLVQQRSGWFYKTRDEWKNETWLSRYKQEKARTKLKDLGVLQERHERRNTGIRLWYRINTGLLNYLLNNLDQQPVLKTCLDDQSRKTGLKEVNNVSEELSSTPVEPGSVEVTEEENNFFFKACFSGTNVQEQEQNLTENKVLPCYSLDPADYVFCHVFIYQFVKTQLQGTIQRSHWQMYGLAHEDLFNQFYDFVDRYGSDIKEWYRQQASVDVPDINGDDITFCQIAGRRIYESA